MCVCVCVSNITKDLFYRVCFCFCAYFVCGYCWAKCSNVKSSTRYMISTISFETICLSYFFFVIVCGNRIWQKQDKQEAKCEAIFNRDAVAYVVVVVVVVIVR